MGFMKFDAIPEAKYLCDTIEDLSTLLPRPGYGDTCWVISEACEYICNSKGEWLPKEKASKTTANVDLTGYATEDFVQEQIQNIEYPTVEVPSKLSELENDANYTQQAYVDAKVADLVNSAPETLDTIGEIAQALKDHQDVADAITEAIGKKADKEDLPSIEGLASEAFVTEAIQKIEFPVTDLSNYYTRDEVTQAIANSAELPAVNNAHMQLVTDAEGNKIWEDKLCYSYVETTEILAEQTLDRSGYLKKPAQHTVQIGQEYTVIYNGITYNCLGGNLDGTPVLGNISLMDESHEDTGEPFLLFGLMQNASGFGVFPQDGPHTFSAVGEQIKYKAIDGNYLAGGIFEGTGEHAHVFNGRAPKYASGTSSAAFNDGDAPGYSAFAIGGGTASGMWSFAGGENAQAKGRNSVAFGHFTIATAENSLVTGSRNIEDTKKQYAHIIGNGNYEVLGNIHTVDWKGNAKYAGDIYVNGSKEQDLADAKKVATEEYVNTKVAELVDNAPETLNTLKEVADALNENASTAEALNQAIGNKVDKTDYPITANPNQVLATNNKGEKIWEEKLAYTTAETIPFLEEFTWDGTQTSFPMAIADANDGDVVTIYIDDVPYTGVLQDDFFTSWLVKFDEEYDNPWIKAMSQFHISKKGYNMNIGGAPLTWAVGKLSATVNTNVVHPIDNKYLGLKIKNGSGESSMIINGDEGATGYGALAINNGRASGTHSVALGNSSASGLYSFAATGGSAKAENSAAFGDWTDAVTDNSVTIGTHNITDENKEYLFIVGNGEKGEFNPQTGYQRTLSNAHTVNKDGTGWFQKEIKVGGVSEHDENAKKVATEEYVENKYLQKSETYTKSLSFNGEIEGKEVFGDFFYKVSDDTPALEDWAGHTLVFEDGTEAFIDDMYQGPLNSYPNDGYNINNMVIVFYNDVEGVASKGIYFEWIDFGKVAGANYTAHKTVIPEELLDSDLVRATAFNKLEDTVKGLDKYCAFMKQGDQIKLGNVQEYSKMQEMLSGANKFHATLAITYVNEEGLLISETCYAKSVMSAIDMKTGGKPYVNFSFETFAGETIRFRWNSDNTISDVSITKNLTEEDINALIEAKIASAE